MKVLIIGSGGREHALAAALAQDRHEVLVAPGNAGIAREFDCLPLTSVSEVLSWCKANRPAFVLFGPEQPLTEGWADTLSEAGIPCVGPSQAAARIESSKIFAKDLMARHHIPTASCRCFPDTAAAREYILSLQKFPIVIKADGLSAGKGVTIATTEEEAIQALSALSGKIVVEEFLSGWEVSLFAITDGESFQTTLFAQDHKQLLDGDAGPNTGGMGAYCPVPEAEPYRKRIEDSVIAPILKAMRDEGCPYRGFLYCGLMITPQGPKVLEFNCRLGDPETQALLPLLETPFTEVCEAILEKRVKDLNLVWSDQSSVCVVLASRGYPGKYRTGYPLTFKASQCLIRFSGVTKTDAGLVTSGGRVMALVGLGKDTDEARRRVYRDIETVEFEGKHYRRDIALRKNVL
ncbi:MAG: phosphoribosylamine--glycine ligase [Candidatus Cloacimonetes bacterium]|nr:phosphoribosylamine--glycine ligase [Candidatus Cloacimonadota bacterium]